MFSIINSNMVMYVSLIAILIFVVCLSIYRIYVDSQLRKQGLLKEEEKRKSGGFIDGLNHNKAIDSFGSVMPGNDLDKVFNRAKNPWGMTVGTFQFIRFGGLFLSIVVGICFLALNYKLSIFCLAIGILCFWYPMYYYKALGEEREAEWSKMYEFIWVLKNNITLYDPAKAYMNTKLYIEQHAPHNLEIISGFDDFYRYWHEDYIDEYITQYYPFSVTREITQIVFNMNKTGDFPEESLNSLRRFIINQQDLTVERHLSSVSGKATIFSLPFLMISIIVALMVPLILQIIEFL